MDQANQPDKPLDVIVETQEAPESAERPGPGWFTVALIVVNLSLATINVCEINKSRALQAELRSRIAAARSELPEDLSKYTVLHMPPSGKCPAGFEVAPDAFERDGKRYAGCSRIGADPFHGTIDRIGPGESFIQRVPLEQRPDLPSVRQ